MEVLNSGVIDDDRVINQLLVFSENYSVGFLSGDKFESLADFEEAAVW